MSALEKVVVKKMVDVVAREPCRKRESGANFPIVGRLLLLAVCPQLIQLNPVVIPELQVIEVLMQWWQLQD